MNKSRRFVRIFLTTATARLSEKFNAMPQVFEITGADEGGRILVNSLKVTWPAWLCKAISDKSTLVRIPDIKREFAFVRMIALVLVSLAVPTAADTADIDRKNLLKNLIVTGAYSKVCGPPSEFTLAATRRVMDELGPLDQDLLELSIDSFSAALTAQGPTAFCRETQQHELAFEKLTAK